MIVYLVAALLGVIAGLRSMTAPAVTSWAASLGLLGVAGTPLAFMAAVVTPWIFTALALGELVVDKLPATPSRKILPAFGARVLAGALCGATIGAASGALAPAAITGALGAVAGTYGGAWVRGRLAAAFGRDLPAALLEDLFAVGGGALVVAVLL